MVSIRLFESLFYELRDMVSEKDALQIASQAYLVSSKLRPAAIIIGMRDETISKTVRDITEKSYSNVLFLPYPNMKTAYILLPRIWSISEKYNKLKELSMLPDLSEFHLYTGTLLGYLTPQPLKIGLKYPEDTFTAEISVSGSNGSFQIAPQIVVGVSRETIETSFAPIVAALNELYRNENIQYNASSKIDIYANFLYRIQKKTRKIRKTRIRKRL